MNTPPRSLLFLSGAGLPAWIWDEVRHRLDGSPETLVAPRPERGSAGHRGSGPGLSDYVDAAIDALPAGPVTIVAHSAGGIVGAEIARRAPDRVLGFLAVSAIVPGPGGSFLTAMPLPNRWVLGAVMRVAGTRPPDSAIRGTLAHGIEERAVARLLADFTPEPQGFYRDRTGPQPWAGRRGYVLTAADRELPPRLQRRFAARLDAPWRRELATGHLPMLENPGALAATILSFLEPRG